jgi:diaminohydroxyphosphoribosylaminopyrimidine deaminase/5-amino-6-(5-phosphoribosylamino)uracil reductase
MRRAIAISTLGLGTTSPNPPVGCVVLDPGGRPVGEGYHLRQGEPHAEANALRAAGESARGGTAVVTLEPCNHLGSTPPCSAALIDAGISRVVVAVMDPTSRGGGGVSALRRAGVSVESGVLRPEALVVMEPWLTSVLSGRPFVTWLCTIDPGGVPTGFADLAAELSAVWLEDVRNLRLQSDAVLDERGQLAEGTPGGHGAGFRLRPVPPPRGPESLLSGLASGGVRMLLLDGGEALAEPFLAGGLVDRAVAYSPGLGPSWRPGASASGATLAFPPSGFELTGVQRAGGWLRASARPSGRRPSGIDAPDQVHDSLREDRR